MAALSPDDIVRTSDDMAVRRRFAARNQIWLTALLLLFLIAAIIQTADRNVTDTPLTVIIAAINAVFVALSLFTMVYVWRASAPPDRMMRRLGRWLRNRINAAVLIFIAIEYAAMLAYGRQSADGWMGWVSILPLLVMGFRMAVAELALLHATLLGGGLLMAVLQPAPAHDTAPILISMCVINGIALTIELLLSRRMRREVIAEWTQRRASAREQVRMRDELRYARELQLSMLPECAPALPWADICSISLPATEVGGDYYDYFFDGHHVALVCGDVAGHGMAAGLVLAAVRSGFTLLRESLDDPAAVLRRLHDLVAETSRRRMLVTISVVLVDWRTRTAIVASAGHPPVLLRHKDGTVELIELFAPPLGVRLPVTIPQRRFAIAEGDTFVLHSDGVYETTNPEGEVYGLERLSRIVRERGGESAESLRDAILADVNAFRAAAEQDDDVTIVVATVR